MTTDFQDLLDDESVDAVMIATPLTTHFPLAQRALEAGKHVFVEKPFDLGQLDWYEEQRQPYPEKH